MEFLERDLGSIVEEFLGKKRLPLHFYLYTVYNLNNMKRAHPYRLPPGNLFRGFFQKIG